MARSTITPSTLPPDCRFEPASAGEAVTDARVGDDVAGARGILRLDLGTQACDVSAQRLDVIDVLRPPDLGDQLAVCHQPAAVAHEHAQQLELDRREVNGLSVASHDAPGQIDLQTLDDDARLLLG